MSLFSILSSNPCVLDSILLIGLLYTLVLFYRFTHFLYSKFFRPPKDLLALYGIPSKSWVAITGASAGIGKAFALSFAERGFNICLIGRNQEKLEKAKLDVLNSNPGVATAIVLANLAQSASDPVRFFPKIIDDMRKAGVDIEDLAVLINNAGTMERGNFLDISLQGCADTLAVNVYPALFLTRLLAPYMINRTKRSLIINLSSLTGKRPVPIRGAYGATKAYNDMLARSLSMELESKIDVVSLKPNYVSTDLTKMKVGGTVISARDEVEATLRDMGFERETAGHWKHDVLEFIYTNIVPDRVITKLAMKRREGRQEAKLD